MALIVEDGTGLDNAESYLSADDFKAYHKDRGNVVSIGGSEIEQKLRLATEYIDLRWGPKAIGYPITETQALVFPTDYFVTDPVSLPIKLERATAEYAFYAITGDLYYDVDNLSGGGIIRKLEKVGPIEEETEYSGSGLGATGRRNPIVAKADSLMRAITNSGQGGVYR